MSEILVVRMPFSLTHTAPIALGILKALTPEIKTIDLAPQFNAEIFKITYGKGYDKDYDLLFAFKTYESPFYYYFDCLLRKTNAKVFKEIEAKILEFEPKMVAFSVNSANIGPTIIISKRLHRKGTKIIWGGCETYFALKVIRNFSFVDQIVVGEAETTWDAIVNKEKTSKVVIASPFFNLNDSPIPDYSDLDLDNYHSIGLETQRGCVNRCYFCVNRLTPYREYYRQKNKKRLEKELKYISKFQKPIYLCDNISNPTKARLLELCDIFSKFKVRWQGEFLSKIDSETAIRMKKAGCFYVTLGLESMNNKVLKKMNKPITVKDQLITLKALKEAGIKTMGMFFFGFPTETFVEALISATRMIRYEAYFDTISIGIFVLPIKSFVSQNPSKFKIKIFKSNEKQILMGGIPYLPKKPYLSWLWEFLVQYFSDKFKSLGSEGMYEY